MKANSPNKVAIIMGSRNDYPIMKKCEQILKKFNVKNEVLIVSAHRTPDRLYRFAKNAHKNNKLQTFNYRVGVSTHFQVIDIINYFFINLLQNIILTVIFQ